MSDTIGSLFDKLSIINVKMYHVQDLVHAAAKAGEGLDPETTQKLVALNLQRNDLVREVDEALAEAISTGEVVVDPRIKVL